MPLQGTMEKAKDEVGRLGTGHSDVVAPYFVRHSFEMTCLRGCDQK
jgi:hypothetical protein